MTMKTLLVDNLKDWSHKNDLAFTFVGILFSVYLLFSRYYYFTIFTTAIYLYFNFNNNNNVLPSSDNKNYTRVHDNLR